MVKSFTLEYWINDGWFIGKLKEIPGVCSQGETLEELEENIRDAYRLIMEESEPPQTDHFETKEIGLEV